MLVTGAQRGIGRAIARAFAERGCTLGLLARSGDELEALAAALPGEGHLPLPADVADRGATEAAVRSFDPCDVVVANAGVSDYHDFQDLGLDAAERMTRINWLGTLYTVAPALPGMIERGRGHVVVVSSGQAHHTLSGGSVYGGTKAAQQAWAGALRHELAGTGVSVTTVFPGQLSTSLHDHEKQTMPGWYRTENSEDPEPIGELVARAVERDRREVHYPRNVRALRTVHGISPRLADFMLRRVRGEAAAPRRG